MNNLSYNGTNQQNNINNIKIKKAPTVETILRGYNIGSSWELIEEKALPQLSIDGSRYHYGYMDSWFAAYKYYEKARNQMFVLLLSTIESKPSTKSYWDQKRWNNQEMNVKFIAENNCANYINYSPKPSEGKITTSTSMTEEVSTNGDVTSISTSLSYTTSYEIPEVIISSSSESNASIVIKYYFVKYATNTSLNSICCSNVDRQNYAIFKINNYVLNNSYNFSIYNNVKIYRKGVINTATEQGTHAYRFTIN